MNRVLLVLLLSVSWLVATAQANEPGAGNCLYFDGVSANTGVDCGTNAILNPGIGSITCAAWVKIDSVPDPGVFYPVIRRADGRFDNGYQLTVRPNGTVRFQVDTLNGPNFNVVSNPGVIQADRWHYIVGVLDRAQDSLLVYVDGVLEGKAVGPGGGIINPSSRCVIGHWLTNGGVHKNFYGHIDDVRVWNKALSETEIRETMCSKLQGNEPNLVGYWRVDEGTNGTCGGGADVCDATGNGNDGVIF